ncbi:MAG: hypothetical protein KDA96_23740 [Planctomycetaceae bacterium]|nr:hypothetical protein [Planctomycetaceae bacterium]
MDLPTIVELTRCDSGENEQACIETLDRETAKTGVDRRWWNDLSPTLTSPDVEPDRHWEWRVIVSKFQHKPYFQSKCVKTQDGLIQAAMLFRVDAMSALDAGKRAVFVDRLATAPQNREALVKAPRFRGGGTALLLYAVAQSYSLGFEGRVNLFPVANKHFYTERGFQRTDVAEGEDVLFELPAATAIRMLNARGLIDA